MLSTEDISTSMEVLLNGSSWVVDGNDQRSIG
jgi:hypothetical protein